MKILIVACLIFSATAQASYSVDRSPKIVGGEDAQIEEFPAVVAMIHSEWQIQWCAGTIISEYWVLTAAHCYIDPLFFVLEYATTDLKLMEEGTKYIRPEDFIQHEKFSMVQLTFDVGLIKTIDRINTGLHGSISRLAMPGSYYPTGTPSTVAGWGMWSYENYTFPQLQKAELEFWDYRECQKAHEDNGWGLYVHSHQVCAGLPDFSKAECSGDSGGPLYIHGVQVGIVSWSIKPCTVAEFPGVYTSVSFFIPWIHEKTGIEFEIQKFLIRKI